MLKNVVNFSTNVTRTKQANLYLLGEVMTTGGKQNIKEDYRTSTSCS